MAKSEPSKPLLTEELAMRENRRVKMANGLRTAGSILRSITKSLDSNAAWQSTFDRGPHEIWCEERERDGHVDLTRAAFLACRDLLNVGI